MGKIVVSDNVSLDGVVQDPAGDEGFRRGGWVGLIKDRPELGKLALKRSGFASALPRPQYACRTPYTACARVKPSNSSCSIRPERENEPVAR